MRHYAVIGAAALAITAVGGVLALKHHVQSHARQAEALVAQIADDMQAIRGLKAEWAYLASPDRIQQRSVRFLALMPPAPGQILSRIEDIPFRLPGEVADGSDPDVRLNKPTKATPGRRKGDL